MGLLTPLFLAGLAALAVPVLLHLAREPERAGQPFPSLMFLRRIPYRVRRRRVLRDRLLLALRALALALLALAFARPYLDRSLLASSPSRSVVLLVDRSYSMGARGRWEAAQAEARAAVDGLRPGEHAALVAFDTGAQVLSPPGPDRDALRNALAALRPGQRGTDLARALDEAARLLAGAPAGAREVVLVSDLQKAGAASGAPLHLPADVALSVRAVRGDTGANLAVTGARLRAPPPGAPASSRTLAVRVRNTGEVSATTRLTLSAGGRELASTPLTVASGLELVHEFPVAVPRDRPLPAAVTVEADLLAADDRRYLVLAAEAPIEVLLAAPPGAAREHGLYLRAALSAARAPPVRVRALAPDALDAGTLATADVVVLDGAGLPAAPEGRAALRDFVSGGGGLLLIPGEHADPDWPGGASGWLPGELAGARTPGGGRAGIAELDTSHPVAAALAASDDPLAGARVWRYRALAPGAGDRVIVRLDDGAPLLVEREPGRGRVLLLTSTADPRWSDLALSPAFAPLIVEAVRHLAGRDEGAGVLRVGETVDLARYAAAMPGARALSAGLRAGRALVVEPPQGVPEALPAGNALFTAVVAGLHELHPAGGEDAPLPLAVNVDTAESALAAWSAQDFAALVIREPAAAGAVAMDPSSAGPAHALARERGRAWWWLVLLAAAVLVAESAVAGRLDRRRQAPAPAPG